MALVRDGTTSGMLLGLNMYKSLWTVAVNPLCAEESGSSLTHLWG